MYRENISETIMKILKRLVQNLKKVLNKIKFKKIRFKFSRANGGVLYNNNKIHERKKGKSQFAV